MITPTEDHTTRVRRAAVASLRAYGLVLDGAQVPVEDERIDAIQSSVGQLISVFADESGATASRAGTAPAFDVTCQIIVQALVRRAGRADVVAGVDALIAQVKDCLFRDSEWLRLVQNISSTRVVRAFKPEAEQAVGDGRLLVECTWREIYPPRVVQQLGGVNFTTTPPNGTPPISAGVTLATP